MYYKGRDPNREEYSGYNSVNESGKALKDIDGETIHVVGIATEYCVRNTVLDFLKAGKKIVVHKDMLGYIDEVDHKNTIEEFKSLGVEIV